MTCLPPCGGFGRGEEAGACFEQGKLPVVGRGEIEVPKTWACPFWQWEERLRVHCQGARLEFKSRQARLAYINRHCAHVPGWEECPIAAALVKEYEGA